LPKCGVDKAADANFPQAKIYKDYRRLLKEMEGEVDALIVSTSDHTHAPASMLVMELGKAVLLSKTVDS
jgi:predicted dehydrogenase